MQIKEINSKHLSISAFATSKRLKESLELLEGHVRHTGQSIFSDNLNELNQTYRNVLHYTVKGVEDPQRSSVYQRLIRSILELSDEVREFMLEANNSALYSDKKKINSEFNKFKQEISDSLLGNDSERAIEEIIHGTSIEQTQTIKDKDYLHDLFFRYLWLTDRLNDEDVSLIMKLINNEDVAWSQKSVIVSGITLGILRHFDEKKIMTLNLIREGAEPQIRERALFGLITALYTYDQRLQFYPNIVSLIQSLGEYPDFMDDILIILKQMNRARDTEKISKRMREEIMPDILKLQSKLEDKLDLNNILGDPESGDKNPDWESMFEGSPGLLGKLEELSKMQIEGTDVFMSAFSMLKNFDFFRRASNWFVPFYASNPSVVSALENEDSKFSWAFSEALESSAYICNSDKHSFCLNIHLIPENQKEMLLNMFQQEMESMNEIAAEDELLNKNYKRRSIYTQYIQDLYRFFKLHPLHNEFEDLFALPFNIHLSWIFNQLPENKEIFRKGGDYFFDTDHFEESLEVYRLIVLSEEESDILYQKIGYCHQQLGNYSDALEAYLKSELFDQPQPWLLKKTALCYTRLGNYKKALEYYREAEKKEPENLNIQISIANCLLHMKDFKEASNYYFKVELESPGNTRVLRPIAWCMFVSGKYNEAEKTFIRLFEKETPNKNDYMNYAHLLWCTGRKEKAIENYISSIRERDNNYELFTKLFAEDTVYLLKHGVNQDDIPIMMDYLKYRLSE